jgi:hypothetical protein
MAPAGFHLTAEESSNHMVGKMITIPIVFVLHLGSALAPWLLEKATYSKMFISFATCLSAGAMLGKLYCPSDITVPRVDEPTRYFFPVISGHDAA